MLFSGLMTDLLGFGLLARPTRRWLQDRVMNRMGGRLLRHGNVYIKTSFGSRGGEEGAGKAERPKGREIEGTDTE
jgi:UPF0716 family protein affecting phage T7 exclusion